MGRLAHRDVVGRAEAEVASLEREMESLARSLAAKDGEAARRLASAVAYLRGTESGEPMQEKLRKVLRQLDAGAEGTARETERAIVEDIERILEILVPPERDLLAELRECHEIALGILESERREIDETSRADLDAAVARAAGRLRGIRARQGDGTGKESPSAKGEEDLARETRDVAADLDRASRDVRERGIGGGEAAAGAAADAREAAGKMDEAAGALGSGAPGAAEAQKDAVERLDAALAKLGEGRDGKRPRPEGEAAREAASDQDAIARRTAELQGRMRKGSESAPAGDPAGEALSKAAEACGAAIPPMGSASAAAAPSPGGPGEMSTARRFQVEAAGQLEKAAAALAAAIDRSERELTPAKRAERILWLITALRKARAEEEAIWKGTGALDGRRRMLADRIVRGEAADLARRQGFLRDEAAELALRLEEENAAVYAEALGEAVEGMERAARRLARFSTDAPTRSIEQEVIRDLDDLIAGLEDERLWTITQKPGPRMLPKPPRPPRPPEPGKKPPLIRDVAQVRLLRVLEARVRGRVELIESRRLAGAEGEEAREELAGVHRLQQRIVRLARSLAGQATAERAPGDER